MKLFNKFYPLRFTIWTVVLLLVIFYGLSAWWLLVLLLFEQDFSIKL